MHRLSIVFTLSVVAIVRADAPSTAPAVSGKLGPVMHVFSDQANLTVKVNGQIQNLAYDVEDLSGHIGLQAEGTPTEFRKVEVRPIED